MRTRSDVLGASGGAALEDALARAVVWRFVAAALGEPAGLRALWADGTHRQALARAVERFGLPGAPESVPADLEATHARLFGHVVRGGVCLYAAEYVGGPLFQSAHYLADLEGWYRAFGLQRAKGRRERADHAAVQCEFLAFLAMREAYALERGDSDALTASADALRRFLKETLAAYGPALAARLEAADRRGFYGKLARLLRALVRGECRRLRLRPGPRTLALRPPEPKPPAACGAQETDFPRGKESDLLQVHGVKEP